MSTKSYTLADGTTATVTETESGVPFNESMGVLTKAIKAKIAASSSGGGKRVPTLTLHSQADFSDNPLPYNSFYSTQGGSLNRTYYINYDGDGELGVAYTNGDYQPSISLNGNKLTVEHHSFDYNLMRVVVYASETATCMGVHTMFCYDTSD